MASKKLEGLVAVVTGSNRGIGRAIALRYAAEGAAVVIDYAHHDKEAREVAREIEQLGSRAFVLQADISRVKSVENLISKVIDKFGKLDILVNNAGIEKRAPFWDVSEEDYDVVVDVNLKGCFFATQFASRYWIQSKRPGKVINISSVHEDLPFPGFASYCASKGGLRMLTRTLAIELGQFGITVNAIAPGAIATPINCALLDDPKLLEPLLDQIPLRRLGAPEDVAHLAAFLASPEASYITGASYFIDGGLTWNYWEQESPEQRPGKKKAA